MTLPYAGAPVTQLFRERWLSGNQLGDERPVGMVEVRRGRLARSYHPFDSFGFPVFGEYPGALANGFWYPDWQPSEDWADLDGVINIRLEQSFDNNGVTSCTIQMDNEAWIAQTGGAGILYHLVEKGYYSPLRGYVPPQRADPGVDKTPFFNKLPNAQIRVTQGYGSDAMVCTFLGLIDDVQSSSIPNQMTLTARDFGGVLTDEKFFGWAKEKSINSPITFATRFQAEDSQLVGGAAEASTSASGDGPSNATSESPPGWQSAVQATAADTQWIEIKIPGGRYSQIVLRCASGMQGYIGIKPTAPTLSGDPGLSNPTMDGGPLTPGVFVDLGNDVPGFFGGWPYVREIPSTTGGQANYITLGAEFIVGDGTIIRLGFRNLQAVDSGFAATVGFLQANQRTFTKTALAGKYIIIDDLSDIVRCCLRWAGFKSWEIENTGTTFARNAGPLVVDTSKSFMDIINQVKDYAGFTFFIAEPLDPEDPLDIGRPVFRNNRMMEDVTGKTEFIDDKLLLTDAKVKISNADDHCIIRCRGVSKDNGLGIDGDRVHRIMFSYIPPWGRSGAAKQAGVFKPITVTNHYFTTLDDCQFGCYLVAIQIGLLKYTAVIDLPCNPGIGVDTLQSVIDRTQGLNSRIYISNRTQEMAFGQNGYWTMELGGGLADSQEMENALKDFKEALKTIDRSGRNPWKRKRSLTGFQVG